jgi:N6-L-threonylcarbamoyladenine synthase
MKMKAILAIETSCDDTSLCIMRETESKPELLSLTYFSQETILKKWGGVVPEIAARNHLAKIAPLLEETLAAAQMKTSELDAVAITTHPGLLGPLLTGLNAAKTICLMHELPLIPVNHIHAHLEAIHLDHDITYPYLGLIVSGGHTLFTLVTSPLDFEVLGSTIDDAAGEAFDKGGKLLGLPYPAGRFIDELAAKGDESKYLFPIGLKKEANCNLSYSGVKTSLRQFLEKNPGIEKDPQELADICAGYQRCIVEALKLKGRYALKKARELTGKHDIAFVIGGGVAANSKLRTTLKLAFEHTYFVTPKYCTDNAAMIANLGLRTITSSAIPFPECLEIDARSRYLDKNKMQSDSRKQKLAARGDSK